MVVVVVDNPGFLNNHLTKIYIKTSLLRRLQAQTIPNAIPPIGQIHPFSGSAVKLWEEKDYKNVQYNVGKVLDGINYFQTDHGKEQC